MVWSLLDIPKAKKELLESCNLGAVEGKSSSRFLISSLGISVKMFQSEIIPGSSIQGV
jgi:hypothetical protein